MVELWVVCFDIAGYGLLQCSWLYWPIEVVVTHIAYDVCCHQYVLPVLQFLFCIVSGVTLWFLEFASTQIFKWSYCGSLLYLVPFLLFLWDQDCQDCPFPLLIELPELMVKDLLWKSLEGYVSWWWSCCRFPDLVVGAPFFFSREEGGAVYIYTNNKNHCLDCKKPLRLTGKPESRFVTVFSQLIRKTMGYQFLLTIQFWASALF